MSEANRTRTSVAEEQTLAVLPAVPIFRQQRVTNTGMDSRLTTEESAELNPEANVSDLSRTGFEPGGEMPWELSYGSQDFVMRGALRNEWHATAERYGLADVLSIGADALGVANLLRYGPKAEGEMDPFAPYHLVRTTGFTTPGNNALFVAGAGTTNTSVVLTGLVAEPVVPPDARAKVVGFQAPAAGDLALVAGVGELPGGGISAGRLTSSTLDFTTLGLFPGRWIKLGGYAAGNRFTNAKNNGWYRVLRVQAGVLDFDTVPGGFAAEAASTKTLQAWLGDVLRSGTVNRSFTVENAYDDVGEFDVYQGQRVASTRWTATAKRIITGSFTLMGGGEHSEPKLEGTRSDIYGADVAAAAVFLGPNNNDVLNASANVGTVYENNVLLTSLGAFYPMELSLTVETGMRRREAIGFVAPVDVLGGTNRVTGSLRVYYANRALATRVRKGTKSSLAAVFTDQNGGRRVGGVMSARGYVWDVPRLTYTGGASPDPSGKDTDRMQTVQFTASGFAFPGQPETTKHSVAVHRFEEFAP